MPCQRARFRQQIPEVVAVAAGVGLWSVLPHGAAVVLDVAEVDARPKTKWHNWPPILFSMSIGWLWFRMQNNILYCQCI